MTFCLIRIESTLNFLKLGLNEKFHVCELEKCEFTSVYLRG